jgi:hypothetical protein
MGECAYYLKAEFLTEKDAKAVEKKLDDFFAEARDAYEFWQSNRGLGDTSVVNTDGKAVAKKTVKMTDELFFQQYAKKFPLMMEYVTANGFKTREALSSHVDFGQDENNEVVRVDNVIGWGNASVWHFADWQPLADFIKKKFGALKVVWDTEENGCGSLDSLQLYEYEEIVKSLLKHTELFPLLLRVHDDLDVMLDVKMRTSKKGKDHARKEETKN